MKSFFVLLLIISAFFAVKAQTNQSSSGNTTQPDTLKKVSSDVVVPKRVVQPAPAVNKTMDLTEIQKIEIEKKKEQAQKNKDSRENLTPTELREMEQQGKSGLPENKPE